ncbi:MAG: DUF4160 domain-containing protein [Hymenobacter sp.]|nr:MAG: DUF4160 domain-containing protein [Hymenobacter sp.]
MPTVLRLLGFRFFFYSNEGSEPPHIHIERADELAKFWLDPVELVSSSGFSAKEINQVRKMVIENQAHLLQAWYEYFN